MHDFLLVHFYAAQHKWWIQHQLRNPRDDYYSLCDWFGVHLMPVLLLWFDFCGVRFPAIHHSDMLPLTTLYHSYQTGRQDLQAKRHHSVPFELGLYRAARISHDDACFVSDVLRVYQRPGRHSWHYTNRVIRGSEAFHEYGERSRKPWVAQDVGPSNLSRLHRRKQHVRNGG